MKTRKVGKKVGSCIYAHKEYEYEITPENILNKAKSKLEGFEYSCIKYDKKSGNVTFQLSEDFDTAHEPIVSRCFLVRADGSTRMMSEKKDPQIWHHKWMWVADDYTGFDVEESKRRSEQWEDHVNKEEKRKIGYLSFWNSIKDRWE